MVVLTGMTPRLGGSSSQSSDIMREGDVAQRKALVKRKGQEKGERRGAAMPRVG